MAGGRVVIGVDIGTQGVKAAAYDEDGLLLAEAFRKSDLRRPEPGTVEEDPEFQLSSSASAMEVRRSKEARRAWRRYPCQRISTRPTPSTRSPASPREAARLSARISTGPPPAGMSSRTLSWARAWPPSSAATSAARAARLNAASRGAAGGPVPRRRW